MSFPSLKDDLFAQLNDFILSSMKFPRCLLFHRLQNQICGSLVAECYCMLIICVSAYSHMNIALLQKEKRRRDRVEKSIENEPDAQDCRTKQAKQWNSCKGVYKVFCTYFDLNLSFKAHIKGLVCKPKLTLHFFFWSKSHFFVPAKTHLICATSFQPLLDYSDSLFVKAPRHQHKEALWWAAVWFRLQIVFHDVGGLLVTEIWAPTANTVAQGRPSSSLWGMKEFSVRLFHCFHQPGQFLLRMKTDLSAFETFEPWNRHNEWVFLVTLSIYILP